MNRPTSRAARGLIIFAAALSLTCSDDPGGGGDANDTVVSGRAFMGGPIADAEVVVYQIATATGERTNERGRGRTDATGAFEVNLGATFNSVEIEVIGGTYVDVATLATVQRGAAVLRGLALDLTIAEKRTDVALTPWSHLAFALGESRTALPPAGPPGRRLDELKLARDLLAAHLGFDPTHAGLADLTTAAPSATSEFKHAVTLAGFSTMAGIAQDDGFADVTAQRFTDVLDTDARSAESLFDGNGDLLAVTSVCPPPPGCLARGPACYNSCAISAHFLRAHLGNGVRAYLRTHPATGQTAATLATWLDGIRTNAEPRLFPPGPAEEFDAIGPHVEWITPATDGTVVADSIAIEVVADDPSGIASLTVLAGTLPVVDTDPTPGRFAGTLDTTTLNDGTATLVATATDTEANPFDAPRTLEVNNFQFGTASGTVVVSGRVAGATVRVYRFDTGSPGALLGQGVTEADGTFNNVQLADGYAGPVLIEAGGSGTYAEAAAPPATPLVNLDVSDTLRTVSDYVDGAALSNLVVSPLTTFAVAHLGFLQTSGAGGATATVSTRWVTASAAMEAQFSVANIRTITPLAADQMVNLTAGSRYGLDLVGLSQTAFAASTTGGGDGGAFPTTMNALRVVRVLASDIADGCWNGRAFATPLLYGGTQVVTEDATRRHLANAIVAYLDSTRNQTPFGGAVDVLSLLDTLAMGGGNTAPGSCVGAVNEHLFDDNGGVYDQAPPTIAVMPDDGAVVGGIVTVMATSDDLIDTRTTLRFTAPAGTMDTDNDATDEDATANLDTRPLVPTEGALVVSAESFDDSGNRGTTSVTWQVDNVAPTVTIGGVADGAWYGGPVTPTVASIDTHPMSFTVTLDGSPFVSGTPVAAEGRHVLIATARDTVNNVTTQTVTFFVDLAAPTLALVGAPPPPWVRSTIALQVIASDAMMTYGSLGMDVAVTATGPSGTVSLAPVAMTFADGRRQLDVSINTTMVGDGPLSVMFTITDRAGHAATLTLARSIDNTLPTVTLAPVRNQAGVMIDGYVSEPTATITGTVPAGGSPTTVTVTATPGGGTGMVAPTVVGAFAYTTTALPEGVISVAASAVDAAGNTASAAPASFVVDRTGPVVSYLASDVIDEQTCGVTVNVDQGNNSITGPPATYACSSSPATNLVDVSSGSATVRKYVARLASTGTNPLAWNVSASDIGSAGMEATADAVRFRVYRGATPSGAWVNGSTGSISGSALLATAYAVAGDWPELVTHSASFTIEIQAKDRLGTWGPTVTRPWTHVPLALPVAIANRGNAPTVAAFTDPVYPYSIYKDTLSPGANQEGPAGAMSNLLLKNAPRAAFVFTLWNPHPQPVNVGFFLPAIAGATYTKRVWDTDPRIAAGTVTAPATGTCPSLNPWPSAAWSSRINHNAPFNCATGSCTCNGSGWNEPADALPATSTVALPDNTLEVIALDLSLPLANQRLPALALTPTVNGRPFFEYQIPAAPTATQARVIYVVVGMPNLDFYAPFLSGTDGIQESDGSGSETHTTSGGFTPTMTVSFYERWGDCSFVNGTSGNCTAARPRRHLRALVEARLAVPDLAMQLNVRQRVTGALTAVPHEPPTIPDLGVTRRNAAAFLWETCEVPGYVPNAGQPCVPTGFIPTTANSQ